MNHSGIFKLGQFNTSRRYEKIVKIKSWQHRFFWVLGPTKSLPLFAAYSCALRHQSSGSCHDSILSQCCCPCILKKRLLKYWKMKQQTSHKSKIRWSICDASRYLVPFVSLPFAKPAALLKVTLLHGCFSRFLNDTDGTKSRKASHIHFHFIQNIRLK